jgi:hypothetical protein
MVFKKKGTKQKETVIHTCKFKEEKETKKLRKKTREKKSKRVLQTMKKNQRYCIDSSDHYFQLN